MDEYIENPEPLIATIARLFVFDGKPLEVAILANARAGIQQTDYDNWNGGMYGYTLTLQIPTLLFSQIQDQILEIATGIKDKAALLLASDFHSYMHLVIIVPIIESGDGWRAKANAWTTGNGVTNQGRVRSDNVASLACDGLLFRSEPEINLYKALKSLGVSFAPLPVFVRGGKEYRRIEPDFVIIKDGIVLVVEVDGDTVHTETPAEAHARTTMLGHEGVQIERVKASQCASQELALQCAKNLLLAMSRYKASR